MWLVTTLAVLAAAPELRTEPRVDFTRDDVFLGKGGVQIFVAVEPWAKPPPTGSALEVFGPLLGAAPKYAQHVAMARVVYTVDRDVTFFTETRARDLSWVQRMAPDMGVVAEPDGTFRVTRTPSNRFSLEWFDAPDAQPALTAFLAQIPAGTKSVVVQRNSGFARVLGFRTAERSVTFTAHHALAKGKTRIEVYTASLLVNLPPPFLGGSARVIRESLDGTRNLIEHLRDYDGP